MPLPYSDQAEPLDGKPPAYGELFSISDPAGSNDGSDPSRDKTVNNSSVLVTDSDGDLSFIRLSEGDALLMDALGLKYPQALPQLFFSIGEAQRVVEYIQKHREVFNVHLKRDVVAREEVLKDVDNMLTESLELRRRDMLLRWFRDPAAPADLNPGKWIDPKADAKGNVLQLLHPLLFNLILLLACIAGVLLTFGVYFHGGR